MTFTVKPSPRSRLRWTVRVHPSATALRRAMRRRRPGQALAMHCPRRRPGRIAGDIHLAVGHLSTEIVTHECAHAALTWARRGRINPIGDPPSDAYGKMPIACPEEVFCYVLGYLSQQVTAGLKARGY